MKGVGEMSREDKQYILADITDISYTKSSYWFSDKKMGVLALFTIGLFVSIGYTISLAINAITIGFSIGFFIIYLVLISKIVFEENRRRQMIMEYNRGIIEEVRDSMNIIKVEEDGRTLFPRQVNAYYVRLNRGLIVNRPKNFKNLHKQSISDIIRELSRQNFYVKHINKTQHSYYNKGLEHQYELNKDTTGNLNSLMSVILNELSKQNRTSSEIEVDYFIIYTRDIRKMLTFKEKIQEILTHINRSIFHSYDILDYDGVEVFLKEEYGVELLKIAKNIKVEDEFIEDAFIVTEFYQDGYKVFDDEEIL